MNINHYALGSVLFVSGAVAQDMAIKCDETMCVMSKDTLREIAGRMQMLIDEVDRLKERSGCS